MVEAAATGLSRTCLHDGGVDVCHTTTGVSTIMQERVSLG
jgi:hypothetical protein